MSSPPQPLFILSMPRSGSTLLQRLVGNGEGVATHAEPWILLPLLESFVAADASISARYDGATASVARTEFVDRLQHGRADLEAGLREFVTGLYASASVPDTVFYLDKTPRYAAYVDELTSVFPDAHFIVLQRDIREVIGSIIKTWGTGRWNVFLYTIDLLDGFDRLDRFVRNPPANCLVVQFAHLVDDIDGIAERISEFLGVPVTAELLPSDDPDIAGSVGDRDSPGRQAEHAIATPSSWDAHFEGLIRRCWLWWYLRQRARSGATVPPALRLRSARHLYDHPSDLVLVPLTFVWPSLNRWTGYRLETLIRSRKSSIVRHHVSAINRRRPAFGRVRAWPQSSPIR